MMTHRFLLRFTLVFLCAIGIPVDSFSADRPNILFIAVDDLRPELGCYGSRALTPNIDALAASGLRFERAYCNQAVCGASRVSLMTGLYPEYTGERTFHVTDWRKRWAKVVTLNQHLTANGYTTVGLGKIYHGSRGADVDTENWTRWLTVPGKSYADPASLEAMKTNQPNSRGSVKGPSTESMEIADHEYTDGARAETASDELTRLAGEARPFFLAVGFNKPHLPFVAPKKYWDLYEREQFSMPDNRSIPPGYPDYARNRSAGELRSYSDIPRKGTPADFPDDLNRRLLHGYHACVSYLDRNVGLLLQALEESPAASNTVVILWSDHGWKLGDHSSWGKHTNFETDTRVPLIIRHPAMPSAKGETAALVELLDLYPTICEFCGLEKPDHLQGRSFLPVLENPQSAHRDAAYSSYPHRNGKQNVTGHSIRTDQHRYTEWWDQNSDEIVDSILTDLQADPGEQTAVKGNEALKAELSNLLKDRVHSARQ